MMKISTRLMLLGGVLSALLVAIGGLGLFGIMMSNHALRDVYTGRMVPVGQLGDIRALLLSNRLAITAALFERSPEAIQSSAVTVETNIARITKIWEAYSALPHQADEEALAKTFAQHRKAFVAEGLRAAIAALRAGDLQEAQNVVRDKVRPLYEPVGADIQALVQLQLDEANRAFAVADARYMTIRAVSAAAVLIGLLFAVVFGLAQVRVIAKQIGGEPGDAANVAQSVGTGDLSQHIVLKAGDSTSLMARMKAMQESLTTVVSSVRQGSEIVATASAEIAQGNHDLSARTEQQASALEETAASMEQLSATVKQNADSAREANELALSASTVAVQGGEVVSQVVETMKGINESSHKISDIISVIDGIAFQTNILALNAAVEAARAGEQGRGFAVVASEVRSLAGRSAEAAKEIKSLISASVERVEHGTALVDRAGTTMTEVVSSIKRVTDIMGEISSASREQSMGVVQVGEAVTQMDQATQQNAALVEQMAAAATGLKAQAQELVQTVAVFKLARDVTGASVHTPRHLALS